MDNNHYLRKGFRMGIVFALLGKGASVDRFETVLFEGRYIASGDRLSVMNDERFKDFLAKLPFLRLDRSVQESIQDGYATLQDDGTVITYANNSNEFKTQADLNQANDYQNRLSRMLGL